MEDLQYKMIMALAAADLGEPLCEQVAGICAEIADQHCTQLHVGSSVDDVPEIPVPILSRAKL
ncbi:hypothetical protein [Streptomyces sp. NPDC002133]|uniref:hypothetical protein n=1 Tax=Streptomyces sp. NPDC002133 TaxID=3154409 RepID=UPI0033182E4D